MKKTKLKLNNLNIYSFTTNLDSKNKETIAGREEALPTSPLKWLWKNTDIDLLVKWETMAILLETFVVHSKEVCFTQFNTCNCGMSGRAIC